MKPSTEPDTELTETNNVTQENNGQSETQEETETWWGRIKKVFEYFTIEQFLLCYLLPIAISGLAVNKINIEKACRVDLNFSEIICTKVVNSEIDDDVIKVAQSAALKLETAMKAWQYPVQSSIPALVVLFVGAWSDRTGNRKALMLIPIVGEIIASFGLILATYFFLEWPLWATALIEAVPTALSGGPSIAFLGAYSYIADTTPVESRTFRMGVLAVIVTIAFPVGTVVSGVLTQSLGYYGIFGITFGCYVMGFIHISLRVHDVNRVKTVDRTLVQNIIEFFHPKNVWDTLSILFLSQKRQRIQIILVICAHILILGPSIGEGPILNEYVMARYNMKIVELSLFRTYTLVMGSVGMAVAVTLFSKYLKMHDSLLGVIATACKTISSVVYGLAPTKQWFYAGPAFDFFGNSGVTAIRSLGSKVVDLENVAKMNSLIGLAEAFIPMVYGPLYTLVFSNTLKDFPGAVYLLGAVMTIPTLFVFLALFILFKRQERDVVKNPANKEIHAHDNNVTAF